MNTKKVILFSLIVILIASGLYFFFFGRKNQEIDIVFIENVKVFEEFEMKKDYDKMIEKEMVEDQKSLDSLGLILQNYGQPTTADTMYGYQLKKEYYISQQLFQKKFTELSQKYTNEVYTRLNQYIKDFGKEKGCDFILGSNGEGNVMYVSEQKNATKELIAYINKKYSN